MMSPVSSSEFERMWLCGRSVCTITFGLRGSETSTAVKFFGALSCASHRMRRPSLGPLVAILVTFLAAFLAMVLAGLRAALRAGFLALVLAGFLAGLFDIPVSVWVRVPGN